MVDHRAAFAVPRCVRIEADDLDRVGAVPSGVAHRWRRRHDRPRLAGPRCLRGADALLQRLAVAAAHFAAGPVGEQPSAIEPDRPFAQIQHRGLVVGDEQQGAAALVELAQVAVALPLECRVADRKRFVDHQDVGVHMRAHGKRQPRLHAARILLHRAIHERTDAGKRCDGIEARGDLVLPQTENGRGQLHVFPAGEVGIEAGAEFEQSRHPSAHGDIARARLRQAADQLQQCRFAGAVAADDADGFAGLHRQVNPLQRREVRAARVKRIDKLQQPVGRTLIDPVRLRQT